MFGEKELGESIKEQWGEFGSHYEVWKDLVKNRDELALIVAKQIKVKL